MLATTASILGNGKSWASAGTEKARVLLQATLRSARRTPTRQCQRPGSSGSVGTWTLIGASATVVASSPNSAERDTAST